MADMTPEQIAAAIAAKMVKPLEWEDRGEFGLRGKSKLSTYIVHNKRADGLWSMWRDGDVTASHYETEAAAKSAAQADYQARMIAGMDMSVVVELEAAVEAAAKIGRIIGFLGDDEGRIGAFIEACGPELIEQARATMKGGA